jgi:hypothetical protein
MVYGRVEDPSVHGLVGKPSNNAKHPLLRELFRSFVRANRTSNGKSNRKTLFFLNPQFTRIANTKKEQQKPECEQRALSYHFKCFIATLKEEGGRIKY